MSDGNGTSGALALALSKAQKAFPAIQKGRTARIKTKSGADYSYTYANLADTLDAVREALAENELAVSQPIVSNGDGTKLLTLLLHSSGEQLESSYPLPDNLTAQEMGSAISYARRYALTSLLGIATEDDDGAQATASGKTTAKPKPSSAPKAVQEPKQSDPRATKVAAVVQLRHDLGIKDAKARDLWKASVPEGVTIDSATDEQLDAYEAALRASKEAVGAAFGTDPKETEPF